MKKTIDEYGTIHREKGPLDDFWKRTRTMVRENTKKSDLGRYFDKQRQERFELMKTVYYTQCKLIKKNKTMITWIPQKYATLGKILRLKDEEGWVVVAKYETLDYNELKGRFNLHKHWREYTDI